MRSRPSRAALDSSPAQLLSYSCPSAALDCHSHCHSRLPADCRRAAASRRDTDSADSRRAQGSRLTRAATAVPCDEVRVDLPVQCAMRTNRWWRIEHSVAWSAQPSDVSAAASDRAQTPSVVARAPAVARDSRHACSGRD